MYVPVSGRGSSIARAHSRVYVDEHRSDRLSLSHITSGFFLFFFRKRPNWPAKFNFFITWATTEFDVFITNYVISWCKAAVFLTWWLQAFSRFKLWLLFTWHLNKKIVCWNKTMEIDWKVISKCFGRDDDLEEEKQRTNRWLELNTMNDEEKTMNTKFKIAQLSDRRNMKWVMRTPKITSRAKTGLMLSNFLFCEVCENEPLDVRWMNAYALKCTPLKWISHLNPYNKLPGYEPIFFSFLFFFFCCCCIYAQK